MRVAVTGNARNQNIGNVVCILMSRNSWPGVRAAMPVPGPETTRRAVPTA
jgi:hypothetical protein